jgi:hypothetical protein
MNHAAAGHLRFCRTLSLPLALAQPQPSLAVASHCVRVAPTNSLLLHVFSVVFIVVFLRLRLLVELAFHSFALRLDAVQDGMHL